MANITKMKSADAYILNTSKKKDYVDDFFWVSTHLNKLLILKTEKL